MARSLSLALHLFLARFRGRRRGLPKALPHPDLAARPEGELIWMHIEAPAQWLSFAHLSGQMAEVRPGLQFLVTGTRPSTAPNFPSGTLVLGVPAETHPDVAAFLDHMRPDLVVLTALSLPPVLISAAAARGIALVLADIQYSGATRPWRWNRSMARALLGHFALIMTRDTASARQIERSCRNRVEATVTGRIEETTQPLPHDEAERAAMA